MEDMILNHGNSLAFLNLGMQVCINPILLDEVLIHPIWGFVFAFLLSALALLFYVMVYKIPPRMQDFLIQTYSDYKLV